MLLVVGLGSEEGWTISSFYEREYESVVLILADPEMSLRRQGKVVEPDRRLDDGGSGYWLPAPTWEHLVDRTQGSAFQAILRKLPRPGAVEKEDLHTMAQLRFIRIDIPGEGPQLSVAFESEQFNVSFGLPSDCPFKPYSEDPRLTAWDRLVVG